MIPDSMSLEPPNLPKWLFPGWWTYVCERPFTWRVFVCRWRGHPAGVVYYNPGGWEPDYHCKHCGDDLG